MKIKLRTQRLALSLVVGTLATMVVALPVAAANQVTQVITAGTRSASVANLTLPSMATSHRDETNAGTMTLTADDSSGTNLGWNVTIVSSAFVYSGANGGTDIPAANFSLTSAAAPSRTSGQAINAVGGPKVPAISPVGTLDNARKTLHALPTFGKGTYAQDLGVSLTIPADSAAGTYTATLTTTISAGP